jgi:hypothetical protein
MTFKWISLPLRSSTTLRKLSLRITRGWPDQSPKPTTPGAGEAIEGNPDRHTSAAAPVVTLPVAMIEAPSGFADGGSWHGGAVEPGFIAAVGTAIALSANRSVDRSRTPFGRQYQGKPVDEEPPRRENPCAPKGRAENRAQPDPGGLANLFRYFHVPEAPHGCRMETICEIVCRLAWLRERSKS